MVKTKASTTKSPLPSPFGVFDQIDALKDQYSKSERRIVEYILKDPHEFARSNVKDVAEATSVSEPTVVRFCQKVGCKGFRDLKLQLVEDLAYRQALQESRSPEKATAPASAVKQQKPVQSVFESAMTALQNSANRIDWKTVEGAASEIAKARRTVICGVGGSSSMMAQELHNRLFRLDVNCCPYVDSYLQRMVSGTLSRRDVALIVSSTGRPRALLDSIELAQHYGATCIGIAPAQSPVGRTLDLCIDLELTQGGVWPSHPNPMRYGQLFLIDCLAYAVALKLGAHADKVLKRVRASVSSLHGVAPLQPIGD